MGGETYIVRPGDSLQKIAQEYSTTIQQLLTDNPNLTRAAQGKPRTQSGDLIYPGDKVIIVRDSSVLMNRLASLFASFTSRLAISSTFEQCLEAGFGRAECDPTAGPPKGNPQSVDVTYQACLDAGYGRGECEPTTGPKKTDSR